MNMSTSECSSRCQSGWTMYLDESVNSEDEKCHKGEYNEKCSYVSEEEEDDNEDLSMVSDASSGPRQKFDDYEENKFAYYYNSQATKERSKTQLINKDKRCNDVDDTASSSFFTKKKSGLMKKTSPVADKCSSGEMKKGRDISAQGSRKLGSARKT